MQKILLLAIAFISLSAFAQISDSYVLTPNDITVYRNGGYDVIITEEQSFTDEIGNPQLPVKIISYVLPYNSTVKSIDISVTQQKLEGNFYIFPVQPPRRLDGSEEPPFVEPNPEIYGSSTPYPNKIVEIINDGYTHGYHVVTVAIYPVMYYPADREIYLRDINFTINYTTSSSNTLTIKKQSLNRAELTKQFVQSMVKNANDVESFKNPNVQIIDYSVCQVDTIRGGSTSAIDVLVPDYIIITNHELKPIFKQLADWKTKKGVPAFIKTVEEIEPNYEGSDLQEKIRNYLKEVETKYDAGIFVLLGGDVNIVPERLYSKTKFATDMYYATVVGTWNANNNDKFGEGSDVTDYVGTPKIRQQNKGFFLNDGLKIL